ncbi:CDP-alcohol phosphatidyltransferase family protein [Candidatus Pacearchaeota archaeon]|nr:CDP-alcohol phosphatidyltransferase family protein [Candidatus Pacearchaeota archaeon]
MKKRPKFNSEKALYAKNPVYVYRVLDPYTVKIAKIAYDIGFSADIVTLLNFILGMSAIAIMLFFRSYNSFVIAAILIILRNIGDTIDGKIARGSGIKSSYGGFSDIVSDWIFFHPALFIAIGLITNHVAIGFLCVIGYMSREFTRRAFERKFGAKAKETDESKKISGIVSLVTKYDLATVFFFAPLFLLFNQLSLLIYLVAIIEYTLLLGELGFDFYCFLKKDKIINKN